MRNPSRSTTMIALILSIFLLFALQGCNAGSNDSTSWGGPESGTTTTTGYTVSGKILSPVSLQPLPGMKCTLAGTSGAGAYSTMTDAQGAYAFSGVPAGNYRLTTTKEGHITDTTYFTVTRDYTVNLTSLRKDDWNTVIGADHPYDPTKAYVTALVDHTGGGTPSVQGDVSAKDPGKDGVEVDLFANSRGKGSGYEARCYFNAQGQPDWNGVATSSNGVALFYRTSASDTYTMKATKPNHTFDDITDVTPVNGEFTNYMMNAKSYDPATTIKIVLKNNSGYVDDDIYMTVTSNSGVRRYYSMATRKMELIDGATINDYAIKLSSLDTYSDDGVTGARVFYSPTENMLSARLYLSVKKAIDMTKEPDGNNQWNDEYHTLFDWVEVSCDGGMFWPNTTTVDNYSMGLKTELFYVNPDQYNNYKNYFVVGFDDKYSRNEVIGALNAMPEQFRPASGVVYGDAAGVGTDVIVRFQSPKSLVDHPENAICTYLDGVVDSSWAYYAGSSHPLTFTSGVGTGTYTFTKQADSTADELKFLCSNDNTVYSITKTGPDGKKITKQIFQCAGVPLENTGNDAPSVLHKEVGAALNRGVFTNADWKTGYYVTNDGNGGKFNEFSNVLHKYAVNHKVYGFSYDDVNDQSSSLLATTYDNVKKLQITIPKMK
jgi:hypothetical protein